MRNDRPAPNPTTAAANNIAGRAPFATAVGVPPLRVDASMNDANVAMPSASPTWRTVVLVPPATPAFPGSMSDRITFVSCELANPTPRPNTIIPGSSARNETRGEIASATHNSPIASRASPVRTMLVMLKRRVNRPPMGAPSAMSIPCGSIHCAACHAEKCFPFCNKMGRMNKRPNWPIASTIVVSRPYRKPRCRSWPNSNSGSRSPRSIARSIMTKAVKISADSKNASGMIDTARVAGQTWRLPTVRSLIGVHHP